MTNKLIKLFKIIGSSTQIALCVIFIFHPEYIDKWFIRGMSVIGIIYGIKELSNLRKNKENVIVKPNHRNSG